MKNKCFITVFCMLVSFNALYSQLTGNGPSLSHTPGMQGPAVGPRDLSAFQNIVNINGQDGFYLKKDLYLKESYTLINGEMILGIPYLFMDWLGGSLSTPDGRVYTDYKLKYNLTTQTVSFLNGKDSLEVNEPVREFMLDVPVRDSMIHARFISANEYRKGQDFYYEVLLDNDKGQLLKTNKKVVASISDGLIASQSKKYLKLESEYFYYDKTTKKMSKIKPSSNIQQLLHISEADATKMQLSNFDLSSEQDMINLMKLYFDTTKLKAF